MTKGLPQRLVAMAWNKPVTSSGTMASGLANSRRDQPRVASNFNLAARAIGEISLVSFMSQGRVRSATSGITLIPGPGKSA
jgi:hypothetical protein